MKCPKCREEFTQEDVKNYEDNERLRKDFEETHKSQVTALNWWKMRTRRFGTILVFGGIIIIMLFGNKPIEETTNSENWLLIGPVFTGIFFWFVSYYFGGKYMSLFKEYKVRRGY